MKLLYFTQKEFNNGNILMDLVQQHLFLNQQQTILLEHRFVSKLGDLDSYGQDPRRVEYAGSGINNVKVDYKDKYTQSQQTIKDNYAHFEVPYYGKDNNDYVNGQGFCCDNNTRTRSFDPSKNDNPELYQYYYHSDHLGSSSLITNLDGDIVQHIEYVPFGEVFIEERNNKWNTPYLFNAKELDEETGLYYYGARYYDPRVSVWLSTDPLQEKYPNISTYAYCVLNPVKFIDPRGMAGEEPGDPPLGINPAYYREQKAIQEATGGKSEIPAKDIMIGKLKRMLSINVENDNATAVDVFHDWITGTGPSERTFDEKSVMGSEMLQMEEVQNGIDDAISNYEKGIAHFADFSRKLSDENELHYAFGFFKNISDIDKNLTRAFHGSFSGRATIENVYKSPEIQLTTYVVSIQITDNMSAQSGFRLPPFLGGYSKNASLFSSDPFGKDAPLRTIKVNYNLTTFIYRSSGK